MSIDLFYKSLKGHPDKQSRYNSYVHEFNEIINIYNELTESAFPELKNETMTEALHEVELKIRELLNREGLNNEVENVIAIKGAHYGR